MPPKPSAEQLLILTKNHHVHFEGPVPPRNWPDQYQHHFRTISKIGRVQYAEYKANKSTSRENVKYFKNQVMLLRKKAYYFLEKPSLNETTWRDLEQPIFQRFDERVLCGFCGHELWKADYEACSVNVQIQDELTTKRSKRTMCCCGHKATRMMVDNDDDEDRQLFDYVKDTTLTHATDDDLNHFRIPMQPDRIIGLHSQSSIPWTESHFPSKTSRVGLPFIIVEAKRATRVPGFRAIQYQTAFPVRRLLKAQNDLFSSDQSSEPSLVWFFAYQGEQWRLYGCTYEDSHVRMYDLWQGNIQSQDHALQLLLIVDYIWSWARDLYRPSVRRLLLSIPHEFHDWSSSSQDRFRPSVSLSNVSSPVLGFRDPDTMQIDEITEVAEHSATAHTERHEATKEGIPLKSAPSVKFLHATGTPELPPSWTEIGAICHSNIVQFEAQYIFLEISDKPKIHPSMEEMIATFLFSFKIEVNRESLFDLLSFWVTGKSASLLSSKPYILDSEVTILLQTYCDQYTWQIKRRLTCIIWESQLLTSVDDRYQSFFNSNGRSQWSSIHDIKASLMEAQKIHGRDSVYYALHDVNLTLTPSREEGKLIWRSWDSVGMSPEVFDILTSLQGREDSAEQGCEPIMNHLLPKPGEALQIVPRYCERQDSAFQDLAKDPRTGNSMLAVGTSSSRPRFCLFVLNIEEWNDKAVLHQLLKEARNNKDFYGDERRKLSPSDWQALGEWSRRLKT